MKQFNETMASQGLQSAGMKQQAAKESAFQLAQGNASIDIQAPDVVADMQQGFLNYGSDFKNVASGLLGSAYATDASTKTQASIASAANKTNASISNSQVNAAAAAAKSNAMMGAAMYGNNAYLKQSQLNDPRISQANSNAQTSAQSGAGWMNTGGNILGGAIKGGLFNSGSSNPSAPFGGIDDGYAY